MGQVPSTHQLDSSNLAITNGQTLAETIHQYKQKGYITTGPVSSRLSVYNYVSLQCCYSIKIS